MSLTLFPREELTGRIVFCREYNFYTITNSFTNILNTTLWFGFTWNRGCINVMIAVTLCSLQFLPPELWFELFFWSWYYYHIGYNPHFSKSTKTVHIQIFLDVTIPIQIAGISCRNNPFSLFWIACSSIDSISFVVWSIRGKT